MTSIRNTEQDWQDPAEQMLMLAVAMGNHGDPSEYILAQESAGQRQLVNSDRLPTRILHTEGGEEAFIALGFTLGAPDPGDKMFRPATLPEGWRRQGSDHSMWSYLVDEHGRERVSIFYKAAFYDRDAHMSLTSRYGYLRRVLDGSVPLVLDDRWLTRAGAVTELKATADACEVRAVECDELATSRSDDYWVERAAEHRKERDKALKLMRDVEAGRKP